MPDKSVENMPLELNRLDAFIHRTESRFTNIRKDCEKKIVWHANIARRTPLSIVYIHGFSASRMETYPLCDRLAASIGANLFYTRLTGHGQDGPAMAAARVTDWLADGEQAVAIGNRLGEKIVLVGTSTGGTLATWLAAQPALAPRIHSLVLLSPNFSPKNPLAAAALWPPALRCFSSCFGGWRSFSMTNGQHGRYWTTRYPITAIGTMVRLVRKAWQVNIRQAGMPVLMLLNPWDRVINVSLAVLRFMGFPSPQKRLVWFRDNRDLGRHVLAGDILSPQTTGRVHAIIRDFLNDQAGRISCG